MKNELLTKWESGTGLSELAAHYAMAKPTILKNKEAIKAANVAKGVKPLTSSGRTLNGLDQ
jgi:hypothetical protein